VSRAVLQALLCLVPVLAIVVPLLARRYPGERALHKLRGRERAPLPRPIFRVATHATFLPQIARGARLMGCSLAVRPPPAALAAS
jgi:hypothetical protein